jgi:hypothetical protein
MAGRRRHSEEASTPNSDATSSQSHPVTASIAAMSRLIVAESANFFSVGAAAPSARRLMPVAVTSASARVIAVVFLTLKATALPILTRRTWETG